MDINKRIEQSSVRVKSGLRLVGFLLLVGAVAYVFGVLWLTKLGGIGAGFFALVTSLEYWNVRRLKSRNERKV
jgi:membrane protein implicated in regulation of membrane protease activity